MRRQTISLNDDRWRFGQVARRPFSAADVYDLPAANEWLPATVPGNVRTDLFALNRIPDPFFAENHKESLWVEDVDWWYRRQITVDELAPHARAFLIFEGIDYLSAIFINGQEMARHEGMFSHQRIEITDALRNKGRAEIAVRLWGSSALPTRQLNWLQRGWQKIAGALHGSWTGVYPDRSATLKCQMSFGWDFAPPIRAMGIWDDVKLVITGSVFIAQAGAVAQPLPENKGERPTTPSAQFTVNLTLDSLLPRQAEATVKIAPANFDEPSPELFHFTLNLPAGQISHCLDCHVPEAALWNPWDRGRPHLYRLTIILCDSDGKIVDEVKTRTGVRAIELDRWQFSINGQREFLRGVNWVPADSFPGRLRAADYERLLMMIRDSGANFIRVWGGGLCEKRAFYDLCDELGLLVWQEFPFACMFLGAYPRDRDYLNLVEAECSAIVRQLQHHPSLILWCGGNEFSRLRNRPLLDTLARVVAENDGTRPFVPTSPGFEHGRDAHNWHVWHGGAPIRAYQTETAGFLSEFGLQALPHHDSLVAALPHPEDPTSWPTHHADLEKIINYQLTMNNEQTQNLKPQTSNAELRTLNSELKIHHSKFIIQNSQLAQSIALQTAIEHMRRRKGEAGGVCLWQFNEPWPAISWAIVDYFGRPKLAYHRLKQWYSPILVCLNFPVGQQWQIGDTFTAEIWAINDTLQAIINYQLSIINDDQIIHTQPLTLPAGSAQCVGALAHQFTAPPRQLKLTLSRNSNLIAQNSYDLNWHDTSRGSFSQRFRRRVAEWVLR